MADINIQRKKSAPSPWILVVVATVVLGLAAYFFLRPDPADEPVPPAPVSTPSASPDTAAAVAIDTAEQARRRAAIDAIPQGDSSHTVAAADAETAAALAAQAATNPAAPDYALTGLQKLTSVLVALTDRDDLRDPTIQEQRDNLTSATNRLGELNASLRPGFVAAAGLIRAIQQKAYPELETQANELVRLASQLSGRSATAAEQEQTKQFLTQAAGAVNTLSEPAL